MPAWRVCRDPFSDLSGEGARLYGGRWNRPGRAMLYLADTPALAVLEVRVHLDLPPDLIPDDFVLMCLDLGNVSTEAIDLLPDDPTEFGTTWLREGRSAALRVPSVIVPEATNVLLNPVHPDAALVSVKTKRPFVFDERLWHP